MLLKYLGQDVRGRSADDTTGWSWRDAFVGSMRGLVSCMTAWGIVAAAPLAAAAEPPPVAVFAARPQLEQLALSPDGQKLLGVMNVGGDSVVVVGGWDGADLQSLLRTDNNKYVINWVHWVNNRRVVVSLRFPSITRGATATETRALAMDLKGESIVTLVPPPRNRDVKWLAQFQDVVIDWLPEDGDHVLMAIRDDPVVFAPSVYTVDVNTGQRKQVLGPRESVWTWITDHEHKVRIGVRDDREKGEVTILGRKSENDSWQKLWSFEHFSRGDIRPITFGKDPQSLYVTKLKDDRQALYLAHLDKLDAQGQPTMDLVVAWDDADVDAPRVLSNGELIGVRGVWEGDAQRSFIDESLKELARGIDKVLPGRFNRIYGFNKSLNRYLVESTGNGVPGQFLAGDRAAGTLRVIGQRYPGLDPNQLVGKRKIKFKARDGLEIRGYLTVPKGDTPEQGWPMVLMPHGGPISSDDIDFDPWTELLASRGYAVLQVNFRGSDNQGRTFRDAGLKRWGLEMQDDLTDGVKWAVDNHVADAKRLCIVGASYGGYAALMGAVKTPDLYRCAVSFAGVSDLVDMSREWSGWKGDKVADKQLGNYWNDRDNLKKTSPASHAAEIHIPVLLIHGTADAQVPYDQSETMDKALKSAGKFHRFVTLEGGDHQLTRLVDSQKFLEETLGFLNQYIGPGAKP